MDPPSCAEEYEIQLRDGDVIVAYVRTCVNRTGRTHGHKRRLTGYLTMSFLKRLSLSAR